MISKKFASKDQKTYTRQHPVQDKCLTLDMYGRPVSLTFHGKEKFKTTVGACLTISVVTILGMFTLFNMLKLNKLQQPIQTTFHEHSFYNINSELDAAEAVQPGKIFAMGLGNTLVDPSIGTFNVV